MAAMGVMDKFFPQPDQFIPERWLRDERAHDTSTWKHDSAFVSLPFSAGLRACPGKRFAEQALYLAAVTVNILKQSYIHVNSYSIIINKFISISISDPTKLPSRSRF